MGEQPNILILKTAAAGDVVRTTCILQHFQHQAITWLTDASCLPFFTVEPSGNLKVYPIDDFPAEVHLKQYHLVLSLEEDEYCAKLAASMISQKITGVYWDNGIAYTSDAAAWFDMSLISVHGRAVANEKKKANTNSFQEYLFSMLQLPFNGERYAITQPETIKHPLLIGLEKTAGHRWPNKTWYGYEILAETLQKMGFQTILFERKKNLSAYMEAINGCSLLVSGDTLAMHLAMAYHIPVVGLFNCTSAAEIHDYSLLHKIISPRVDDFFYSTSFDPDAIRAVPMATVLEAVLSQWCCFYPAPNQIKARGFSSGFQQ